jgi:hypothetical protein
MHYALSMFISRFKVAQSDYVRLQENSLSVSTTVLIRFSLVMPFTEFVAKPTLVLSNTVYIVLGSLREFERP